MKKNIYLIIAGGICIAIVAFIVILTQKTPQTHVHAEVQAGFLVHVPQEWIGNYATSYTEQGDVVFYFNAPEGPVPLFVIHKRSETLPEGAEMIGENSGFIYGVTQTERNIYSGKEKFEFNELQKSVPSVIASFTLL